LTGDDHVERVAGVAAREQRLPRGRADLFQPLGEGRSRRVVEELEERDRRQEICRSSHGSGLRGKNPFPLCQTSRPASDGAVTEPAYSAAFLVYAATRSSSAAWSSVSSTSRRPTRASSSGRRSMIICVARTCCSSTIFRTSASICWPVCSLKLRSTRLTGP